MRTVPKKEKKKAEKKMTSHSFSAENFQGERLDKFLSEQDMEISRSGIAKLIDEGNVTVCGKAVKKNYRSCL